MSRSRSIFISGASSGIGLYCAVALQARGYQVIAGCRHSRDISRLQSKGIAAVRLDLNQSESIRSAVEQVRELTGGTLDALFNNAGFGQPGAVEDLTRETLRLQFETNVFGTHELTREILPLMLQQGYGRIIQNSSVLGLTAMPFRGAYVASKFALEGLTDTLRLELVNTGISVSLIEPGPILSNFKINSLAALKANINIEHSRHQKDYQQTLTRLTSRGASNGFTLGPEAVLKRLIHALEAKRPKARYYVTLPTYFFATLKRLLTTRALDRLLVKASR